MEKWRFQSLRPSRHGFFNPDCAANSMLVLISPRSGFMFADCAKAVQMVQTMVYVRPPWQSTLIDSKYFGVCFVIKENPGVKDIQNLLSGTSGNPDETKQISWFITRSSGTKNVAYCSVSSDKTGGKEKTKNCVNPNYQGFNLEKTQGLSIELNRKRQNFQIATSEQY